MASGSNLRLPEGGKARRLYLALLDDLAKGNFPPGSMLPGEQRLREHFGVSRVTVRRALEALEAEGLIERRPGSGTRVRSAGPAQAVSGDLATLMPQLVDMERRTTARLLSFSYGPAPDPICQALGLPTGARVQTAVRIRLVDGQPFSHLTTHVPEAIATGYSEADLAGTPLFRLLERSGVRLASADQQVTAALAAPDTAEALGVSVGAPLLFIRRIVRDEGGRGVEHLSALYRSDLFRIDMSLARVGSGEKRYWEPVFDRRST